MGSQPRIDHLLGTGSETSYTSELRKLSSDPAITKHPDPNFHFRFRNPDELGEEEPVQLVANPTTPTRRAYPTRTDWRLRRSPKE
jgi:hypothetical protein